MRRLRWVAGLALVAFLIVAVIGLLNSSALAVDVVTVNGVDRDLASEVYSATDIEPGQPLVDVDTAAVEGLVEELPWVRSAAVSRSWNGTVVVEVEQRQTLLALAGTDGSDFVGVDQDGIQVTRLSSDLVVDAAPIPLVQGLAVDIQLGQSAPPSVALAINFLLSAPADIRDIVGQIEVADEELFVVLTSGSRARLGDSRQLGAKYQSLETVLQQVDLSCLESVDVSVPSAPSLTRSCADGETGGQDG